MSDPFSQGRSALADRIEDRLNVLIGEPLVDCWRAANMQMFEFGPQQTFLSRRGLPVKNGQYRLHVQCPWRMVTLEQIVFSNQDLGCPADPAIDRATFDYDKQTSLLDVKQRAFFKVFRNDPLVVSGVKGNIYGGVRIDLEPACWLECIPFATSADHEYWRFFDGFTRSPHFVVKSDGVEEREGVE